MPDLLKFKAKICYTSAGLLIHQNKVLLVKHKKLGIWLAPGGHIEGDELPHEAAEREFWEETGLRVKAYDPRTSLRDSKASQYFPSPVETNLHWVSEENYHSRLESSDPEKRHSSPLWKRGCEQHLGLLFLVKPAGSLNFKQNTEETDGIGWFSLEEAEELETTDDIKMEIRRAYEIKR